MTAGNVFETDADKRIKELEAKLASCKELADKWAGIRPVISWGGVELPDDYQRCAEQLNNIIDPWAEGQALTESEYTEDK